MRVETIEDPTDPRLADYRCLTDVKLRTEFEPPNGLFIAEGELVLRRAVRAGYRPRSLLVDQKRVSAIADIAASTEAPIYAGTQDVLEAATGFHVHRGMLASVHRPEPTSLDDILATARRIAILEDVNNHTNVGAIFRCAAGLGMDAVLLSPSTADPLYRRSVRVSMGEVFAVPYARVADWPSGITRIREAGFPVLAMTLSPDAVPLDQLSSQHRDRVAMLLGAEGPGLTEAAVAAADLPVSIPMAGGVDSLNVAAAAAVAFWEITRTR